MAQSKKTAEKKGHTEIEEVQASTGEFLQKISKPIIIVLIAGIVIAGGYFGYTNLIAQPRVQKATEAMFVAEQLFAQGDFETALNGDGGSAGFIEVADTYGSSAPGRLAAHYAGICYLKQGDLDAALEYLSKYKAVKGAPAKIINAQNFGLRGDIYAQKGDLTKAGEFYKKAIEAGDNIVTTPYFLKKQAVLFERQGNYKAALDSYRRVKDEYGNSLEAYDVDKRIGALEQK